MADAYNITNEQLFYKLELINKDMELLKVRQNDFSEFMKKTEALSYKIQALESNLGQLDKRLSSFEDKIDELCEKIDKSSLFNQTVMSRVFDYGFKIVMFAFFIYAALHGVKLPGVTG
ncbi:hypothetical protein Q0M94_19145 (plasmid) [Deinococcus radiomollis]|uniref:hypothetical protein n=1 Tax=Deinococcus radiomollis TaxID=468916 RepID=UPI00389240C2